MKYRIPERLVTYILDQLNIKEIVCSKYHSSISRAPGAIQVVTRHAEYVPPSDSESDPESEVEELEGPPLHSSRSTMGRRQAHEIPERSEIGGEEEFHTPPESPSHPQLESAFHPPAQVPEAFNETVETQTSSSSSQPHLRFVFKHMMPT